MDATTVIAMASLAFTSGTGLVSVTIYAANTRGIAKNAEHKARNIGQGLAVYARRDVIEPQLTAIRESLKRIEENQAAMTNRLIGGGA